MMTQTLRLVLSVPVLFGFWLLLSGKYDTWLVVSAFVCAVGVIAFSRLKRVTDGEEFPVEDLPRVLLYWLWLIWQMALSALSVSRLILRPDAITPTLVQVEALQSSAAGITTYANSITLTPGTITVEASEQKRRLWVHAITRENAEGFADDAMNEWVAWVDGER